MWCKYLAVMWSVNHYENCLVMRTDAVTTHKCLTFCKPTNWKHFIPAIILQPQHTCRVSVEYLGRLGHLLWTLAGMSRCRTSLQCSCTEHAQECHRCGCPLRRGPQVDWSLRRKTPMKYCWCILIWSDWDEIMRCWRLSKWSDVMLFVTFVLALFIFPFFISKV